MAVTIAINASIANAAIINTEFAANAIASPNCAVSFELIKKHDLSRKIDLKSSFTSW